MNPLWVGNAIIRDGLPCFNLNIVTLCHWGPVKIVMEKWPYNLDRQQPKTSLKAVQIFAYGLQYFSVSAPNSLGMDWDWVRNITANSHCRNQWLRVKPSANEDLVECVDNKPAALKQECCDGIWAPIEPSECLL